MFDQVDFSALDLRVGESYTAVLNVLGTSSCWGVRGSRSNEYAGGSAFFGQPNPELLDLSFRITPVSGRPVSEPATLVLFGAALVLAWLSRQRRAPR